MEACKNHSKSMKKGGYFPIQRIIYGFNIITADNDIKG